MPPLEEMLIIGGIAIAAIFGADLLRNFGGRLLWLIMAAAILGGLTAIFADIF